MVNPFVSFIVVTRNRSAELRAALDSIARQDYAPAEIVLVDNGSVDDTPGAVEAFARTHDHVRYHRLEENRGVSGGRNFGIQAARGEILVSIDDDAVLLDSGATARIVERFLADPSIGVLTFKIVGPSGEVRPREFPTFNRALDPDVEFETSHFLGGGHAIRRQVHETVGLYVEHFFFWLEDLEVSWRVLDAGFRIVYFPSVTVMHMQVPSARLPRSTSVIRELENRFEMNVRHLPWRYVLSQHLIRMGYALLLLKGNPLPLARHVIWCAQRLPGLLSVRRCVRRDTLDRFRRNHGRLLY